MAAAPAVHPTLHVVMLGPPGAGKGTQAERLATRRGIPKISTGDILRRVVLSGSVLGGSAKQAIESGNLVGDDAVIGIVTSRLECEDARVGFVLDGFPRTVVQATALDTLVEKASGPLVVLDIVVPEEVLVRRLASRRICSVCGANAAMEATTACLKCGGSLVTRVDDGARIVRERLKVYQRQTKPLVDYYLPRPTFHAIDGNQPPDAVTRAIDAAIVQAVAAGGTRQ